MEYPLNVIIDLPIEVLDPNPFQMRTFMDPEPLEALGQNIQEGMQERPIKVRPNPDAEGRYEIGYGHRTTEALRRLGYETVRGFIVPMSDMEMAKLVFSENEFHVPLCAYDKARWFESMTKGFDWTQETVARFAGIEQPLVSHYKKLIELVEKEIVSLDIIVRFTEYQGRAFLASDRHLWPELGRFVAQFHKKNDSIPSYNMIRDRLAVLRMNYNVEDEISKVVDNSFNDEVSEAVEHPSSPISNEDVGGVAVATTTPEEALKGFYDKFGQDASITAAITHLQVKIPGISDQEALDAAVSYRALHFVKNDISASPPSTIDVSAESALLLKPENEEGEVKLDPINLGEDNFREEGYRCCLCGHWTTAQNLDRFINKIRKENPEAADLVLKIVREGVGE